MPAAAYPEKNYEGHGPGYDPPNSFWVAAARPPAPGLQASLRVDLDVQICPQRLTGRVLGLLCHGVRRVTEFAVSRVTLIV